MENSSPRVHTKKLHLVLMLGYSETELLTLESFMKDLTNSRVIAEFDRVSIGVCKLIHGNKLNMEKLTSIIQTNVPILSKVEVEIIKISGGDHVGKNRYDLLSSIKEDDNNREDLIFMMDIDDQFIDSRYWRDIMSSLRSTLFMSDKWDMIVDFNYINLKNYSYQLGTTEVIQSYPFVKLNARNERHYDPINGYKYYNPKLRVSGVAKFAPLRWFNLDLFKNYRKYEDSLIFAELYSLYPNKVYVAPYASVGYNRDNSSTFTATSVEDPELEKVILDCKESNSDNFGTPIPYIKLRDQINAWKYAVSKKR